jgi:hypothetical protein
VVPDDGSPLYRVDWPDIGLSEAANLTRCKQTALAWAESKVLTDLRKKYGVGALKMLDKFSWSAAPVRQKKIPGNSAPHPACARTQRLPCRWGCAMSMDKVLEYALRGWLVFPLKPESKLPATRRGFHDATTNPATLKRWFGRDYPYNVGVRTGQPSGVFVLDIDGTNGAGSLCALIGDHGPIPATLISQTGSGWHLWFSTDVPVPCSVGKIAPGIDVRGDGGYVAAPPSVHPDGAIYRWTTDLAPAAAPAWLIRLAQQPKPVPISERALAVIHEPRCTVADDNYGRAALESEIHALATVSKGGRNAALNLTSFRLYQLVAGGELNDGEVKQRLIEAAHANGLMTDPEDGPRAVLRTIQSGANAGMRYPRDRRGRR